VRSSSVLEIESVGVGVTRRGWRNSKGVIREGREGKGDHGVVFGVWQCG